MRCVAAPSSRAVPRPSAAERAALDAVRHLSTRFAQARLREVPLVRAFELDAHADPTGRTRIWLALEALQVTGSFKVRGALVSVEANRSRGHVVAAGAGNHALAVAYAARVLDVGATVCVPRPAPRGQRRRLERYGAEVVVTASDRRVHAEDLAKEIAATHGAAYVSSCDDLDVARGSGASLGFEIVRALGGVPERVLVPVGGGALAAGLSWALACEAYDVADAAVGRGRAPSSTPAAAVERVVWGVQSDADCALADAFTGPGEAAPTPAASACDGAFSWALEAIAGMLVVADAKVRATMAHAYREMGLVLEARGAAALAPVLTGLPEPLHGGDLVVVLTGRNVERDRVEAPLQSAGDGAL